MQRRPKKSNPLARKPKSRHTKVECPYCGETYHKASLTAHYAVAHREEK